MHSVIFLIAWNYGSGSRNGFSPSCIEDTVAKYLLPVPMNLGSAGLEFLVPKGSILIPADTMMMPIN